MIGLLQRIENQIQNRRLLKRGQKILVAVSGGLDSMVLLYAMEKLSAQHKWKITVAHFNHQLRGRASDADEKLVRKTAAKMKLPLLAESADVKTSARQSKLSIEMAARKLRHKFFAYAARVQKINAVAVAHHADDQVELFFLRLLRGAGGEGLAGMKWHSPSSIDKTISIVRPLLGLSKNELLLFARENKIQFRVDATNLSSDFLRNRIRNELLPSLKRNYQPGLTKTVLRLMEITGAESDFVGEIAKQRFEDLKRAPHPGLLPAKRGEEEKSAVARKHSFSPPKRGEAGRRPDEGIFDHLTGAVQRRILQSQLMELGVAVDFNLIESLRQSADVFVSAGSKISVARNESGKLKLRTESKPEFNANKLEVKLSGRGEDVNFNGVEFCWSFKNGAVLVGRGHRQGGSPHRIGLEFFDADKIGSKIILRHWRAGDRFQPIGLKSAAKLQDLFTNSKIPRERRRGLIVAEAASGEIFWVEGLRISENFKITPQTKRQLVWNVGM